MVGYSQYLILPQSEHAISCQSTLAVDGERLTLMMMCRSTGHICRLSTAQLLPDRSESELSLYPAEQHRSSEHIPVQMTKLMYHHRSTSSIHMNSDHGTHRSITSSNWITWGQISSTASRTTRLDVSTASRVYVVPYMMVSAIDQADFTMVQLGFTIGTSSSLFNAIIQTANATLLGIDTDSSIIQGLIDGVLSNVGADLRDSEVSVALLSGLCMTAV